VRRPRLIALLNDGLECKLTLVSAPAGFGKTTLLSDWITSCQGQVAWLSLDEGDNDPTRFLAYLVAALQTIEKSIGAGVLGALQSSRPPTLEAILTALLNDLTTLSGSAVLVLDDYHVLDAQPVDRALAFLLEHLPSQIHLVIATREDPQLPLARLRAGGHLRELRAADLRFTVPEATAFLNQAMALSLSAADVADLDDHTEGWVAGLQLAAISLRDHPNPTSFIHSFTGSHHFVMDYLVEEVLQRQPESVQEFLRRTSILDRLSGPLCDAVLLAPFGSGQTTLEYLERTNLFIAPLDNERHWYRYHHLFAELLQQRLQLGTASVPADEGKVEDRKGEVAELHRRASIWYEEQGLGLEAFQHAAAAQDVEHAVRLIEGNGMPLHFRGAIVPVFNWLKSQPTQVLDAWPMLWTAYASTCLATGQTAGIEEKLCAAEKALEGEKLDDTTRDLIGRIAAIRATAAVNQNQVETIIAESYRALEFLAPDNLAFRTSTAWKLGYAYQLLGDRAAAHRAFSEVISISQASGNMNFNLMASIGLGEMQEADNQLHLAAETYRRVLELLDGQPLPVASAAHLGLAHISYEWNDLDAAELHGRQSVQLVRQIENNDRFISCEVFLARLKLAQGDAGGAAAILAEVSQSARQQDFVNRIPEITAAQVLTLLRQGHLAAAAQLAGVRDLPISWARIHLAQRDPSTALAVLASWRLQVEAKRWEDERLKVMLLQALALQAQGAKGEAVQLLLEVLTLAEPGGFIRSFVDEGPPMAHLLSAAAAGGLTSNYVRKLLATFEAEEQGSEGKSHRLVTLPAQCLIEPLSSREVEVLQLMAQGLSNQEIAGRLFLALDTVKWHNRHIFGKLQVQRRTEAVARARELGLV
jgi:LuxR family maltose regulon positive regulatory protein